MKSTNMNPFNKVQSWVFDLDNTLYAAECDLFSQVDKRIGDYVQSFLGLNAVDARKVQKKYLVDHGTTLKGLMAHHDVDPHHYLDSVHDIDFSPITRDERLRDATREKRRKPQKVRRRNIRYR